MRGKDHFDVKGQFRCGITPAYAGKRHNDRNGQVTEKDHPRVCGEKSRSGLNLPRSWGSPPRMRGKVKTPQKGLQGPRITPAYAGKRPLASLTTSTAKDHPRVCGEKYNYGMANKQAGGSPPRMRGKAVQSGMAHTTRRITPAYAGKSSLIVVSRLKSRDHPRVCGEKRVPPRIALGDMGSPPRMRGKVFQEVQSREKVGITPAYAGKSPAVRMTS